MPAKRGVTVRFHAVAPAHVGGTAMLSAAGAGTKVIVRVVGLAPGGRARVILHAGSCSHLGRLSASFATLPALRANAAGQATSTGRVRFHVKGHEDVRLSEITRGGDVIVIVVGNRIVACGSVPR